MLGQRMSSQATSHSMLGLWKLMRLAVPLYMHAYLMLRSAGERGSLGNSCATNRQPQITVSSRNREGWHLEDIHQTVRDILVAQKQPSYDEASTMHRDLENIHCLRLEIGFSVEQKQVFDGDTMPLSPARLYLRPS